MDSAALKGSPLTLVPGYPKVTSPKWALLKWLAISHSKSIVFRDLVKLKLLLEDFGITKTGVILWQRMNELCASKWVYTPWWIQGSQGEFKWLSLLTKEWDFPPLVILSHLRETGSPAIRSVAAPGWDIWITTSCPGQNILIRTFMSNCIFSPLLHPSLVI